MKFSSSVIISEMLRTLYYNNTYTL